MSEHPPSSPPGAGAGASSPNPRSGLPAPALLIGAMLVFQLGNTLGYKLLPSMGTAGAAFVRNLIGGVVLYVIVRPQIRGRSLSDLVDVTALGLVLAVMNIAFFGAIARIPIAAAITISFLGPLTVALIGSRRPRDVAWVAMAAAGVALFGGVPGGASLNKVGLAFAVVDGACWGSYALVGKRVARAFPGLEGLSLAMLVSALVVVPFVPSSTHGSQIGAEVTVLALIVGVVTAVSYSLELAALRRMRAATYGVLVSLEPAMAVATGALVLGQHPSPIELTAVALVVGASLGAARTAGAVVAADVGMT